MSHKVEFSDSDFEPVIVAEEDQTCNYCNRRTKLIHDKPYCGRCHGLMFRECKRCHKPYHLARYFEKDEARCNSCFEKLQRERLKRAMKKQKVEAPADDDEELDQLTGGPSRPKKKATTSSSLATVSAEARPATFGDICDLKEARLAYIPIIFK